MFHLADALVTTVFLHYVLYCSNPVKSYQRITPTFSDCHSLQEMHFRLKQFMNEAQKVKGTNEDDKTSKVGQVLSPDRGLFSATSQKREKGLGNMCPWEFGIPNYWK